MADAYTQQLHEWLQHEEAVHFIETTFAIFHTCDDITDGDKQVSVALVQDAFLAALVTLPRNPFYMTHFAQLNTVIHLAIVNWQVANRLETSAVQHGKHLAYVLRSSYVDLVTMCAMILYGTEKATKIAYEARISAAREGFDTYLARLRTEHRSSILIEGHHA